MFGKMTFQSKKFRTMTELMNSRRLVFWRNDPGYPFFSTIIIWAKYCTHIWSWVLITVLKHLVCMFDYKFDDFIVMIDAQFDLI